MKGGREISVSDEFRQDLQRIAEEAFRLHRARLWFVEILGKRWSYIAGVMPDVPSPTPAARIELGDGIGLVAESWGDWSEEDRQVFLSSLENVSAEKKRLAEPPCRS